MPLGDARGGQQRQGGRPPTPVLWAKTNGRMAMGRRCQRRRQSYSTFVLALSFPVVVSPERPGRLARDLRPRALAAAVGQSAGTHIVAGAETAAAAVAAASGDASAHLRRGSGATPLRAGGSGADAAAAVLDGGGGVPIKGVDAKPASTLAIAAEGPLGERLQIMKSKGARRQTVHAAVVSSSALLMQPVLPRTPRVTRISHGGDGNDRASIPALIEANRNSPISGRAEPPSAHSITENVTDAHSVVGQSKRPSVFRLIENKSDAHAAMAGSLVLLTPPAPPRPSRTVRLSHEGHQIDVTAANGRTNAIMSVNGRENASMPTFTEAANHKRSVVGRLGQSSDLSVDENETDVLFPGTDANGQLIVNAKTTSAPLAGTGLLHLEVNSLGSETPSPQTRRDTFDSQSAPAPLTARAFPGAHALPTTRSTALAPAERDGNPAEVPKSSYLIAALRIPEALQNSTTRAVEPVPSHSPFLRQPEGATPAVKARLKELQPRMTFSSLRTQASNADSPPMVAVGQLVALDTRSDKMGMQSIGHEGQPGALALPPVQGPPVAEPVRGLPAALATIAAPALFAMPAPAAAPPMLVPPGTAASPPGMPGGQGTTGVPGTLGTPAAPAVPAVPWATAPQVGGTPALPDAPSAAAVPSAPMLPGTPAAPTVPAVPPEPGVPVAPIASDAPGVQASSATPAGDDRADFGSAGAKASGDGNGAGATASSVGEGKGGGVGDGEGTSASAVAGDGDAPVSSTGPDDSEEGGGEGSGETGSLDEEMERLAEEALHDVEKGIEEAEEGADYTMQAVGFGVIIAIVAGYYLLPRSMLNALRGGRRNRREGGAC